MAQGQTTDPEKLAQAKSRDHRAAQQHQDDVRWVMAHPQGRRFMYSLIFERCGVQDVYLADDQGIFRQEGKRVVGAVLVRELQTEHTEQYLMMINEKLHSIRLAARVASEATQTGETNA